MNQLNLDAAHIVTILKDLAADLKGHAEELRQLDAIVGDGDLGITIELASKAISEYLASANETDVGRLLAQCGLNINKVSPSTFGTILASAFIGAGKAVMGKNQLEIHDLLLMGEGAVENIQRRGKAQVGDKTVLDAIVPAVEVLKKRLGDGTKPKAAIKAAVKAAEDGMKATTNMKAKFGRARWVQDSSVGVQDGGATAMYYMIESFARLLNSYY